MTQAKYTLRIVEQDVQFRFLTLNKIPVRSRRSITRGCDVPVKLCGCAFDALERRKVQLEPDGLLPGLRQQLCDGSIGPPLISRSEIHFRVLLQKYLTGTRR
jgi:hypothetical protein